MMFPPTRDHKITCSPEKSHTSSIILNQNIRHIWSSHLTFHCSQQLWFEFMVERRRKKKTRKQWQSRVAQTRRWQVWNGWMVNGRTVGAVTYFWIFNSDFYVKIIQHSNSIDVIPNAGCERGILYFLLVALSTVSFQFLICLCCEVFKNVQMEFVR